MFDRELFRKGDSAVFRQLVREVSPRMLGVIRSYSSDDDHAEELLQQSWVQIYRKRARFSGRGSFPGWAMAVTRNVCRMSLRSMSGMLRAGLDDYAHIPDEAPDPAARLRERRRANALQAALEMRLLEGRRTSEVAELMGIKEASVRSLIHRALGRLRRMQSLKRAITEAEGLQ